MVRWVLGSAILGSVLVASVGLAAPRSAKSPMANVAASVVENALLARPVVQSPLKSACPSNMAQVGRSCVDKYEGSLVEVGENGAEKAWSPYDAPNGHKVRAVSRPNVTPQAHISMVEASKACKASGKRLCRADEWKTACKGPEHTRYPYGNERTANACVDTGRTSPMGKLHGGRADGTSLNDPQANQQDNTLAKTASTTQCTNGYGVHDMVGNIHEWTADGTFRGGYYLDTKLNGEGCDYKTTAHAKTYYDYSTGFRCCADAEALPSDAE